MGNRIGKLFVVDDDKMANVLSRMFFEKTGCVDELSYYLDGEMILEKLQEIKTPEFPDMILLDINMPRMNGFEFLEAIKSLDHFNPKTKIVVLSTSSDPDDITKAYSFPKVHDFFVKPLNNAHLEKMCQYVNT